MADLLLESRGLSCERDGRTLFADMNLELSRGTCLQVVGPNGSGKSTLLRAIAGLYPDYDGEIETVNPLYVGHRLGVSALLTAAENLAWYRALTDATTDISAALTRVGMGGYERVLCQHMSAGQQRRVGLARLIVCAADLWLLDEPLTALDRAGVALVHELLAEHVAGGGSVLCATHQPLELAGVETLTLGTPS